jgi:hypothetical protein
LTQADDPSMSGDDVGLIILGQGVSIAQFGEKFCGTQGFLDFFRLAKALR